MAFVTHKVLFTLQVFFFMAEAEALSFRKSGKGEKRKREAADAAEGMTVRGTKVAATRGGATLPQAHTLPAPSDVASSADGAAASDNADGQREAAGPATATTREEKLKLYGYATDTEHEDLN